MVHFIGPRLWASEGGADAEVVACRRLACPVWGDGVGVGLPRVALAEPRSTRGNGRKSLRDGTIAAVTPGRVGILVGIVVGIVVGILRISLEERGFWGGNAVLWRWNKCQEGGGGHMANFAAFFGLALGVRCITT